MPLSERVEFTRPLRAAILSRQTADSNGVSAGPEKAETFSKEDINRQLERQKRKLEQAHAQALQKAREEGRRAGREEALAESREQAESARMEQRKHLRAMLEQVDQRVGTLRAEVEDLLPELIVEGVGRVLHAWEPNTAQVKAVVADLLEGFDPENGQYRLSLNAEDWKLLREEEGNNLQRYESLNIREDAGLQRGECYLEGRFGVADARFSAKLQSLREVLE